MGAAGNPAPMVSVRFTACLVATLLTAYCPLSSDAVVPRESQTRIHTGENNGQREGNGPSAGDEGVEGRG